MILRAIFRDLSVERTLPKLGEVRAVQRLEHGVLRLDDMLELTVGDFPVEVAVLGGTATDADCEVFQHLRRFDYKLWRVPIKTGATYCCGLDISARISAVVLSAPCRFIAYFALLCLAAQLTADSRWPFEQIAGPVATPQGYGLSGAADKKPISTEIKKDIIWVNIGGEMF